MAFQVKNWTRVSSSGNSDVITLADGTLLGAPAIFCYISATDLLADMQAPDYFAQQANEVSVSDLIYIVGTDGEAFIAVAGVALGPPPTVLTVVVSIGGGGTGDVTGPVLATDNAVVVFNGTTGKVIKNSVGILNAVGELSGLTKLNVANLQLDGTTINSMGGFLNLVASSGNNLALSTSGGGSALVTADPTVGLGIATKQYVDGIAVLGLQFKTSAIAATTANLTATYVNGAAGVGATLTNSGALAAFSTDGVTPAVGSRILVNKQTLPIQNGIYTLTTAGSGAIAWILTRTTDFDTSTEIVPGSFISIEQGTLYAVTSFLQTATVTTVGTDPIIFNQFTYGTSFPIITVNNLTADRVVVSNASKQLISSSVTAQELPYALLQNGSKNYAVDSSGTDAYAITLSPIPAAYTNGMVINFKAGTANTGAATLNVNGLGTIAIKKEFNQALVTGDIKLGQIVTVVYDGTNFQMQSQTTASAVILPTVFVSTAGSNVTGTGTMSNPYATYEFARASVAGSATATNPQTVGMIGYFTIVGNMILSPFVNVAGIGTGISVVNISGQILLDANFATTTAPFTNVQNIVLNAAGNINLTFGAYQDATIYFDNVDFKDTSQFNATGLGTNVACELIVIKNCISIVTQPAFTFTNVRAAVVNSNVTTTTAINNSAVTNSFFVLTAPIANMGNMLVKTTSTGTLLAAIQGCFNPGATVTIDGTNVTFIIDSASYGILPTFANGATFSQVQLVSLSDGVAANTNFTPANYTPTASAGYKANSVTGNLKGIDNALASVSAATSAVTESISQAAHGFVVGNVIYQGVASFAKAKADNAATAEVYGMVSTVTDANNFIVTTRGHVAGLAGLTKSELSFLSATVAGAITNVEPTTVGQISKPLFIADSTTSGNFVNYRGNVVSAGGSTGSSLAKAWTRYYTTGGVATNVASFNVSGVTYNGPADVTINFTTPFASATAYTFVGMGVFDNSTSSPLILSNYPSSGGGTDPTASACRVRGFLDILSGSANNTDLQSGFGAAFFGD